MKTIIDKFEKLLNILELLDKRVEIKCAPLSPHEAIGNPERKDFPLLKGKEKLMEANFMGSFGNAYTDEFNDFSGTLKEILSLPMKNNFERAVLISSINAVLRHMGLVEKTKHCRDKGPKLCAEKLVKMIEERFEKPTVALVGLQPAMAEKLSEKFPLKILDLDPENIGKEKFGTKIMDGEKDIKEVLDSCDIALVTGTCAVNNTMDHILELAGKKPLIFFGVTIAGIAYLKGQERFCPEAI